MSDIVAVLVIPAEGDPGGLLARGRLRAMPPSVHARLRESVDDTEVGVWGRPWAPQYKSESALPLWWDGALVPEGWDRAQRAANTHDTLDEDLFRVHPDFDDVDAFAGGLVECGLASRVVRLARVDGRLVEVTP